VAGIAATLAATSVFIKFNWYDKLEKAPRAAASSEPTPKLSVAK
jgi:hypothetical protein